MVDPDAAGDEPTPSTWRRAGSGLEFDRASFFADAVYAIAMTLIVVGIDVPSIPDTDDPAAMGEALADLVEPITIFFVTFLIIGQYWLAHHRFVAGLDRIDRRYLVWQIPYLALVAFLPFPSQLIGAYFDNPVAVTVFALTMAGVSGLELVLAGVARADGLRDVPWSEARYRWHLLAGGLPVGLFLLSIPAAYASPWLAVACWMANSPAGFLVSRRAPAGTFD